MNLDELLVTFKMLNINYDYTKTKCFLYIHNIDKKLAKTIEKLLEDYKYRYIVNYNIRTHCSNIYIYTERK
jgi:uncharacterized protein YaaR (DUF327 family)